MPNFVVNAQVSSHLVKQGDITQSSTQPTCPKPGTSNSDKRNFIGTSLNGQVNFLLLDLYLHDHQNVFSKEFNFIMTISNIFDNVFSKTCHIFVYDVLTHKVT
jgi:hypothetical protein